MSYKWATEKILMDINFKENKNNIKKTARKL